VTQSSFQLHGFQALLHRRGIELSPLRNAESKHMWSFISLTTGFKGINVDKEHRELTKGQKKITAE